MTFNHYGVYESPKDTNDTYCKTCYTEVHPHNATWYNIGISHYSKDKGVSYIQDHSESFCCNHACADTEVHRRIEAQSAFPHGIYHPELNPNESHPTELVKINAEYTPISRTWSSLPTINAITGEPLGDDIYVPHVDRWSHNGGRQGGYHQFTGELGTATLDQCIDLCHILVDKVLG